MNRSRESQPPMYVLFSITRGLVLCVSPYFLLMCRSDSIYECLLGYVLMMKSSQPCVFLK